MVLLHPPLRRWSLVVVAWTTIGGLIPHSTTALQGYLDSISQPSRPDSMTTQSAVPPNAAETPPPGPPPSSDGAQSEGSSPTDKVQMDDIPRPPINPPPQPLLMNGGMNGEVDVDGTDMAYTSDADDESLIPSTAARTGASPGMGSYLDSLKQPSATDDDTYSGYEANREQSPPPTESVAPRKGSVESDMRDEDGVFGIASSSLSSSSNSESSYVEWLATQYQNPSGTSPSSFDNNVVASSTSSPPPPPQQQQQQQQQQPADPYSMFPMSGDGTIPQSADVPANNDVVSSSLPVQSSAASDSMSDDATASEIPTSGDETVSETFSSSDTNVQTASPTSASNNNAGWGMPPASNDAFFATPISTEDPTISVPRRPSVPPPLPRATSPTQSYLDFAGQQPATSWFIKEDETPPFFVSGIDEVRADDLSPPSSQTTTPKEKSMGSVLQNPLQSIVDAQIELMYMENGDIADRTLGSCSPYAKMYAQMLEENVRGTGDYWKKYARIVATGGVSIEGDVPGERKAPDDLNTVGMTERIMKRIPMESQATGAGGASTWQAFQSAEANWARLKQYIPSRDDPVPPPFVTEDSATGKNFHCYQKLEEQRDNKLDYDIVVCGGTLGIFFATALQLQGHRVCLVEAGKVRGREQEWNISMDELLLLKKLGIVTQEDIDAAIQTEFPGCRSGFKNREIEVDGGYVNNGIGFECFTEGVLNLGVSPSILLERVSRTFKSLGGIIKEDTRLQGISVSTDVGAALDLGEEEEPITARLVIDAMGNSSPITRQQRYGMKPDGVCVVVGSCAGGYDPETNRIGDIIYTNTPIQDKGETGGKMQYFWEAFPVGIGRDGKEPGTSDVKTTYMFTYIDADQRRPTLESLMEDYWRLLPQYQPSINNPETDLDVRRVLFAYFPTYRESPLQPQFSRILPVGDASGIQSPLSFGGFGALTRHLERVTIAVTEAMDLDIVNKENLACINPYTPNLSAAWMFQKAMSVRMSQPFVDRRFVNRLLATNFEVMYNMGNRTIKPFLQDVVRFDGLVGSLGRSFVSDPTFMPQIVGWVGVPTLVDWVGHVGWMGVYAGLDNLVTPWLRPVADATLRNEESRYRLHRQMDAWRYGSGNDYDVNAIPKN